MIQKAPTIAVMITPAMYLAFLLLFGFSVVSNFSFLSFFCSLSALQLGLGGEHASNTFSVGFFSF